MVKRQSQFYILKLNVTEAYRKLVFITISVIFYQPLFINTLYIQNSLQIKNLIIGFVVDSCPSVNLYIFSLNGNTVNFICNNNLLYVKTINVQKDK